MVGVLWIVSCSFCTVSELGNPCSRLCDTGCVFLWILFLYWHRLPDCMYTQKVLGLKAMNLKKTFFLTTQRINRDHNMQKCQIDICWSIISRRPMSEEDNPDWPMVISTYSTSVNNSSYTSFPVLSGKVVKKMSSKNDLLKLEWREYKLYNAEKLTKIFKSALCKFLLQATVPVFIGLKTPIVKFNNHQWKTINICV